MIRFYIVICRYYLHKHESLGPEGLERLYFQITMLEIHRQLAVIECYSCCVERYSDRILFSDNRDRNHRNNHFF